MRTKVRLSIQGIVPQVKGIVRWICSGNLSERQLTNCFRLCSVWFLYENRKKQTYLKIKTSECENFGLIITKNAWNSHISAGQSQKQKKGNCVKFQPLQTATFISTKNFQPITISFKSIVCVCAVSSLAIRTPSDFVYRDSNLSKRIEPQQPQPTKPLFSPISKIVHRKWHGILYDSTLFVVNMHIAIGKYSRCCAFFCAGHVFYYYI